jgi:hypothetical protein
LGQPSWRLQGPWTANAIKLAKDTFSSGLGLNQQFPTDLANANFTTMAIFMILGSRIGPCK